MMVKVRLFAIYQEVYNRPELVLDIAPDTKVKDILEKIVKDKLELAPWLKITRFAVNFNFVSPDYILKDGDEVAFIPPVSGG